MPISRLLVDRDLTPEQRHVIVLAFAYTLRKLRLADSDPMCDLVARKVIEIAATGVTNAVAITEIALRSFS